MRCYASSKYSELFDIYLEKGSVQMSRNGVHFNIVWNLYKSIANKFFRAFGYLNIYFLAIITSFSGGRGERTYIETLKIF